MNNGQVALQHVSVWTNLFLIPLYLALGLVIVQSLISMRFRRLPTSSGIFSTTSTRTTMQAQGFFKEAEQHIKAQGWTTAVLNFLRLLGTLMLAGLTTTAFLVLQQGDGSPASISGKWDKKQRPKRRRERLELDFTQDEWIEIIYLVIYSYSSLLALITLVSKPRWRSIAGIHLTLIMLAVVSVYGYRDIYPLATFTLVPKDASQGWLLWSRICTVSFVAILVPLVTPHIYHPVDPTNPFKEVNREQTASWLSFLTFSFLDSIIWLAARTPHLEYEALPPLADYDAAAILTKQSEKTLDSFLLQKKTHLFWGLLNFFAWEYVQLIAMMILRVCSSFLAPIGINRLLAYLQSNGNNAFIRPWVWILCLFLGPNIGSFALQYYIFLATRCLVRAEAILTQLAFDHALRIRMKEDFSIMQTPVSNAPETRSVTDGESINSEGETLQDAGSSTVSSGKTTAARPSVSVDPATGSGRVGSKTLGKTGGSNMVGKINNLVTTDLGNITEGRDFLFLILYGPLQLILCAWFLYAILNWSALVGMLVMVLAMPLPGYTAKLMNNVQTDRMAQTDARIQTVAEILSVIRMTKLFGWEHKVDKLVAEKRETELRLLRKRQLLELLTLNLNFFFPLLTMLTTFATHTLIRGKDLDASILFTSIAIFQMLQNVLHGSLFHLPVIINAKISLGRFNDFLQDTELLDHFTKKETSQEIDIDPSQNIPSEVIGFYDASFIWGGIYDEGDCAAGSSRRRFRLTIEGELFFQKGKLNIIIGPTGSGKTSLLLALLGEMHYQPIGETAGFNLPRDGGIAYAAQESWVQNETIKDNILFGKPYEKQRYDKVIYQCGLDRDLSLFEAGDQTEVGEKGLTLSGGQKARITLARAVYSGAEILLLDDILAALDVHTAKFVVDKCLQGDLLRGRTIILVTHNVAMVAPIANFVVSLGLDGRIASKGGLSEALTEDHKLLEEVARMNGLSEKAENSAEVTETGKDKQSSAKLVVPEEIPLGHVGWSAIKLYVFSMGSILFWGVVLSGFFLAEAGLSGATWFLGYWASQYERLPSGAVSVSFYLSLYSGILLSVMALYSMAMGATVLGSIRASRTIHRKLIRSILGTTLRWLDTVPTARIIARCTQDMRAVDGPISQSLSDVIELTITLLIRYSAVILFVPMFVLPGIFVFIVGGICGQLYIKAQLSIKREMSNRRSPVIAHFGAAISGIVSIRAYGAQDFFKSESLKRIDGYTRAARAFYNCNRWISIRSDIIGGIFSAGLAAVLVYGRNLLSASNTGFTLTMAVGISEMILWWVRRLNEFEVQGNSLERIEAYVNIEQEPKATETGIPPAYWPASGSVKVENLCARYSMDGPQVLHDISFEIKSGDRVGVVGRTGSGKSSLMLALLRCIVTEGRVTYDGLATDTINLDALRSNITIIPQQPELLSGTLRENLDPFSEHSDATLNDALRAAGLFNLQEENDSSKLTLDSSVSTGGGNLSVGQRQIMALARAIVRQSKLLIFDEATSAVDYATDHIIQNTLREVLKDATLITVAHRLQTIMDADKIIVLDAGKMVEYGSPASLLRNKDGYFHSLVDESGDRDGLFNMVHKAGKAGQSSES